MNLGAHSIPIEDALLGMEQDELEVPPLAVLWLPPEDKHGLRRNVEYHAAATTTPADRSSNVRASLMRSGRWERLGHRWRRLPIWESPGRWRLARLCRNRQAVEIGDLLVRRETTG